MSLDERGFSEAIKDFVSRSEEVGGLWALRDFEGQLFAELRTWKSGFHIEYNIVHSVSYMVPVIYFRLFNGAGEAQTDIEEVAKIMGGELWLQKLAAVSQMPHPYFQTPYFQVHPCHTKDWMEDLDKDKVENYIVSWLSVVGPQVGINLPNSYYTCKK